MEALNSLGLYTMLTKIPGGNIVAQGVRELGGKAENVKALEQALEANPVLKTQADLIGRDFPSLAAVLGIGYLSGVEEE
jgi:hypothetical protein